MKVKVYENTHPPGKHAGEVYQTGVGWMPAASKLRPFRSSSKSKPSGSGGLTTRQLQQRLRRHGYNVAVDGIMGPQTRAALKASRNGVKAKAFNGRGIRPGGSSGSGTGVTRRGGGSGGGGGGGGGSRGGGGGGGGGGGSRGRTNPGPQAINANKYAQASTNLQFNGLLNELARQQDELHGQTLQNQADITSWFNQVADAAAHSAQSNDQASQQMMQRQGGDFAGLLQALGGSASGAAGASLGNFQQALSAGLAGIGAAQHNFDTTRQTQVGQESAQAHLTQQRGSDQALADLAAKIAQTKADKGQALVKNRFDAGQLRLQQMAAIQNMAIAGQTFNLDKQLKQGQIQNQNIANQALGHQLAQQLKNKGHGFKTLTAGDRAKLGEGANSVMYGANMGTGKNPRTAWVHAANVLSSLGYDVKNSPAARRWLSSLWMNYVSDYNNDHSKKYKPAGNGTPWPDSEWR